MSYSLKQGETVSLNALLSRNNKFTPPAPIEELPTRLLNSARKDARRNNLDALWYVIRHAG